MKDKELNIILCIGIPGSGKTTWCNNFLNKNENYVRVSRDDFRLMFKNAVKCDNKIENLISESIIDSISNALAKRLNVLIDNCNLRSEFIDQIVNKFRYSANINFQIFDISVKKAIENDKNRNRQVGETIIKDCYNKFICLIETYNFQNIKRQKRPHITPNFESKKINAVIYDIDGTLALMNERGPFDFDKVFSDKKNEIVAETIPFHINKNRKIILLSGRDSSCRKDTEDWLEFHNINYDELYMRPINDVRKDTIVKLELYNNYIKEKYNIICVYDDRLSVLEMWNNLGIFAMNVNQFNIKF